MTTLPFILICFYLRCFFLFLFFICSSKQTLGCSHNRNFTSVETDSPCQLLKVTEFSTSQSKAVFIFVLQVENFFYFRFWIILRELFQMWQICGVGGCIRQATVSPFTPLCEAGSSALPPIPAMVEREASRSLKGQGSAKSRARLPRFNPKSASH